MVEGFPEIQLRAQVSGAAAGRLFIAAPRTLEAAIATGERSEAQSFPLNLELTLTGKGISHPIESANVLGWLPGFDPNFANDPIVLSAHLDHLGLGPPVRGDAIYNGAMDNAIGIGVMLAIAEELATGPRLRRPVLFAAVTAEEKGELGSNYLARHAPTRVRRFAANINVDMALFLGPVRDIVAYGGTHSTLGAAAAAAAGRCGFTVSPDPMPDRVIFIGSDQYAFVRAGVPAIFLKTGQRSIDPSVNLAERELTFRNTRYHQPSDDLTQTIDWPSVDAFAALITDLTRNVANDQTAPVWLPNDFFGKLFDPEGKYQGKESR